jgi:hypothetical protein
LETWLSEPYELATGERSVQKKRENCIFGFLSHKAFRVRTVHSVQEFKFKGFGSRIKEVGRRVIYQFEFYSKVKVHVAWYERKEGREEARTHLA